MVDTLPGNDAPRAAALRFDATVLTADGQTILTLPRESSAKLPSRGQVAVTGTMNSHPIDTVIEPDGMRGHWIKVDNDVLQAQALRDGDTVSLEIEVTTTWPEPDVPHDFQNALNDASETAETWSDITPMARWEWVRWINATRNPDTRARRIEVAVSKLQSGKRRPCCFDLSSCTDPELSRGGKLVHAV